MLGSQLFAIFQCTIGGVAVLTAFAQADTAAAFAANEEDIVSAVFPELILTFLQFSAVDN